MLVAKAKAEAESVFRESYGNYRFGTTGQWPSEAEIEKAFDRWWRGEDVLNTKKDQVIPQ